MLIPHARLRAAAHDIFRATGSAEDEAEIVADHLVEANIRGHDSHGIILIPNYLSNLAAGTLLPNRRGSVLRDDGPIIVYDGERGYGQVVARAATARAVERAQKMGIALVALRNAHHIGRVGTYGEQCAAAGFVGLYFVNVTGHRPFVAPHRGTDSRLATNPICIALPGETADRPIVLDMATSKVAVGKIKVARNEGRRLAPDLLLDGAGRPTTDPEALFEEPLGAVLPLGEHKGYGLAFVCELLAGAVAGGGTLKPENQGQGTITNSMLAFVIDPERLVDRAWLRAEIAAIAGYVTASPPRRADEPVLVPGDPERIERARRMAEGVPVDDATWRQLAEAARGLGLDLDQMLRVA